MRHELDLRARQIAVGGDQRQVFDRRSEERSVAGGAIAHERFVGRAAPQRAGLSGRRRSSDCPADRRRPARTVRPASASEVATLIAVVVLPTPPSGWRRRQSRPCAGELDWPCSVIMANHRRYQWSLTMRTQLIVCQRFVSRETANVRPNLSERQGVSRGTVDHLDVPFASPRPRVDCAAIREAETSPTRQRRRDGFGRIRRRCATKQKQQAARLQERLEVRQHSRLQCEQRESSADRAPRAVRVAPAAPRSATRQHRPAFEPTARTASRRNTDFRVFDSTINNRTDWKRQRHRNRRRSAAAPNVQHSRVRRRECVAPQRAAQSAADQAFQASASARFSPVRLILRFQVSRRRK